MIRRAKLSIELLVKIALLTGFNFCTYGVRRLKLIKYGEWS